MFAKKNVSTCSYSHIFSKNTWELDNILTTAVNILTTNKLVKLTILWTTGPWTSSILFLQAMFSLSDLQFAVAVSLMYWVQLFKTNDVIS